MGSTRRPALALARPQAPQVRLRLRAAVIGVGVLGLVFGGLYLAARETAIFAVREIRVTGVSDDVAAAARAALRPVLGSSLVAIEPGEAERLLGAVPTIRDATIDRDFPHTLRVDVTPERAAAVVRSGDDAWLVSDRGRILRRVEEGTLPGLPRVWLGAGVVGIAPGKVLPEDIGGAAVRAVSRIPSAFPVRVEAARGDAGSLALLLPGELELRLGDAADLRLKLQAAAAVLDSMTHMDREALLYLDVSLPGRPVTMAKSQLGSRG
jgi:cell division protein FtsQ